ncbi:MAG: HAD family acid phosphatase [Sphingorhabdus sp.]
MRLKLGPQFAALMASSLLLSGCAATQAAPPPANASEELATQIGEAPTETSPPTGHQWLYGSAESVAASRQAYGDLLDYVMAVKKAINAGEKDHLRSVILKDGLEDPLVFRPCLNDKLAVIFDADETLIWNVGFMRYMAERRLDFDPKIWSNWEKTGAGKALAIPGAAAALGKLREMGVTIIANTNRSAANAKGTQDTLRAAGLGEFKHGETLFLRGDTPGGSDKDGRRAIIAGRYCVIAMAGDQLGDFAHGFNAKGLRPRNRRALASRAAVAKMWGNGWFLLPNPVYGPSIRGGFDDVYPPETKWSPEQE